MFIDFTVNDNPDPSQWDDYVSRSPHGHFMQSYSWGQFMRQAGWEPHYLLLGDGATTRGAALLLARVTPLFGKRIFYAPRGPVVDVGDGEAVAALSTAMAAKVRAGGGISLRCDPYVAEPLLSDGVLEKNGFRRVRRDWSYWNAPRLVMWLDLTSDLDTLFTRTEPMCRRNIRTGYKSGITYRTGGKEDLPEFYRLMVTRGQDKSIAVHDQDYYRMLYETLSVSAPVELFLADYESKVISVGMSVRYGDKAWLLYAASDKEYYRLKPNQALQWEMIKWAHAAACSRYDFRGTATSDPPDPRDPGYGVYEFKKRFGPEFTRLAGYYDLVGRPGLYRLFRVAEEKLLPTAYQVRTLMKR